MDTRLIFVAFVAASFSVFAASASKLEEEAEAKESDSKHDVAVRLFAQAAEQRMKDAEVIVVKGEKEEDPLALAPLDDFAADDDEMDVFGEMTGSKEAISKQADTKVSFYIAAALDYEKCEQSDKADKAFALAEKVPNQSEAGKIELFRSKAECEKIRAEYEKAVDLTRKALALTNGKPALDEKRAQLLNDLSDLLFNAKRYKEAFDAKFEIIDLFPKDGARLNALKGLIEKAANRGEYGVALEQCRRFNGLKGLSGGDKAWAIRFEASVYRRQGDKAKAAEIAGRLFDVDGLNRFEALKAVFDVRVPLRDGDTAWTWFEDVLHENEYGFSNKDLSALWSYYGYKGYLKFRPDRSEKAIAEIEKLKSRPGCYAEQWVGDVAAFKELETFPRPESEIIFPKDASAFGVEAKSDAYAKDFGFDEADATECVQQAIDSGATTIILENVGKPWYISSVTPRSNQTIVFEKGVQVLAPESFQKSNAKESLFVLKEVENIAFIGKGEKPEDVYIGKFKDNADRNKYCSDYGGSIFALGGGCKNILIRNLYVANSGEDGICLGGLPPNRNIYVEDVVLDHHYRQACSICGADGLYFKNVSFLNTIGGDPMLGIDLEPTYESEPNANIYLFDCKFAGNAGGGLNFSSSTYYPVTLHAKRCVFEPHGNCDLIIFARSGVYMGAGVKAPSRILIEDCDIKQHTSAYAIRFNCSSIFDVEFKNSRIIDVGEREGGWGPVEPILFSLDREYWYSEDGRNYKEQGTVKFDNLVIDGFKDRDEVVFRDRTGHYSVTGLVGTAVHNGVTVDMAKYRYLAPDCEREDIAEFDPAKYGPPADPAPADAPAVVPVKFDMNFRVPWYTTPPTYTAIYWDGGTWKTKPIRKWCKMKGLAGKAVAYYAKSTESIAKLSQAKGHEEEISFYFEVPAGGKECTFKAYGGIELRNPKGEIVKGSAPAGGQGYSYYTLKPESDAAEIWSVKMKGWADFKFFAPLSGIFAEKPEWLPRAK